MPVLFSSTKPFAATLIALVSEMAIPSPAEYVTPPAVLMVYVSTPVSDVDFVTVTLLPWATLIRLRTAALPVSEILPKSTLALPVLRDEIELLIPVIDVLIVSIAVVCPLTVVCNVLTSFTKPELALPTVACNVLTSLTKPEEAFPTVFCKPEILPAFTSIAALLSATFFTKPVSASFTVASNALIESVCPLTVDFNVLISLVLVATLVFKLPTVMEESAAPSLTSSVILPELIEVTLTA